MSKIAKGSVVKIASQGKKSGYYRVTSLRGQKANLGPIFGKGVYHKGVPVEELVECHSEWYARWSQSESYQCM
jgi:hypothetical protein